MMSRRSKIIKQTKEEMVNHYMKLPKEQLVEMIVNLREFVELLKKNKDD